MCHPLSSTLVSHKRRTRSRYHASEACQSVAPRAELSACTVGRVVVWPVQSRCHTAHPGQRTDVAGVFDNGAHMSTAAGDRHPRTTIVLASRRGLPCGWSGGVSTPYPPTVVGKEGWERVKQEKNHPRSLSHSHPHYSSYVQVFGHPMHEMLRRPLTTAIRNGNMATVTLVRYVWGESTISFTISKTEVFVWQTLLRRRVILSLGNSFMMNGLARGDLAG